MNLNPDEESQGLLRGLRAAMQELIDLRCSNPTRDEFWEVCSRHVPCVQKTIRLKEIVFREYPRAIIELSRKIDEVNKEQMTLGV